MFSFVNGFRDNKVAKDVCALIERLAGDRRIRIVHVCGTHEDLDVLREEAPKAVLGDCVLVGSADVDDADLPVPGQFLDEPADILGNLVVSEPLDEAEHHRFLSAR